MEVVGAGIFIQIQQRCLSPSNKCMELRWVSRRRTIDKQKNRVLLLKPPPPSPPTLVPIYISTNPSHINPDELKHLYTASNHSCHRFPNHLDSDGRVEPVDIHKLRIALSHSSFLVSVFCKPHDFLTNSSSEASEKPIMDLGDLYQKVMPVTPFNSHLVGFGRAVSDFGLTASIYDVMVIPSLRGMGIGKVIVKRIVRMLASRDIFDISALCSENERLFFKACGFGGDILGSTTMMYTRKVSTCREGDQIVIRAGRKLLSAPPHRVPSASPKASNS